MITIDTHALIWWIQQPEHLSLKAVEALQAADLILIPAIAFWEIALLVRKKRLALSTNQDIAEWAAAVMSIPRIREVPLSSVIAVRADGLEMHDDAADRFIVATALQHKTPLITKDNLLRSLGWIETVW